MKQIPLLTLTDIALTLTASLILVVAKTIMENRTVEEGIATFVTTFLSVIGMTMGLNFYRRIRDRFNKDKSE